MDHTKLTLLILEFSHLLDTGRYDSITVEEVKSHIEDGTILDFLQERAGEGLIGLGSFFRIGGSTEYAEFYVPYLQSLLHAYGGEEWGKWGIENRGLCLLIAWTNEILQQGSGWSPRRDVV